MKSFKNLNILIKFAISFTILAMLVMRMDKGDFWSDLSDHFVASAWLYSSVFMLLQVVLLSWRWQKLLNIGKRHMDFMTALKINLTSQIANLFFITSVGGILARIAMSAQHGASIFKTLIATVFDRIMTLCALVLLSAAFMPGLAHYVDSRAFSTFSVYLSVLVFMIFIFAPLFLNAVVFRMPQTARLKGRMRYGLRYLKALMRNPALCGKIIGISLAAQLSFFVAEYFIARSTGADLTFWQLMTVLPIIALLSSLPISVGGWGVREGAFVYFLGILDVPMETAFLISIQIGLIGMIVTVLAGIPYIMTSDLRFLSVSSLKENLAHIRSRSWK